MFVSGSTKPRMHGLMNDVQLGGVTFSLNCTTQTTYQQVPCASENMIIKRTYVWCDGELITPRHDEVAGPVMTQPLVPPYLFPLGPTPSNHPTTKYPPSPYYAPTPTRALSQRPSLTSPLQSTKQSQTP